MPAAIHTILLVVHAAAFSALLASSSTTIHALASPLPMPLMAPDYGRKIPTGRENVATPASAALTPNDSSPLVPDFVRRFQQVNSNKRVLSQNAYQSKVDKLNKYYNDANRHSDDLKDLASRSSTVKESDYDFHHQSALALTSFHTSILGFQSTLKELGAEKGLANYDRSNDVETLLKNIVNLNKDTLSYITVLCYNIPVLGPVLGPIVYDIKCILDDVLNAVENLTDALLNVLKPLLAPLIGGWSAQACLLGIGIRVADICI